MNDFEEITLPELKPCILSKENKFKFMTSLVTNCVETFTISLLHTSSREQQSGG